MLAKQKGHYCLGRPSPRLYSWWKAILFLSSSSLALSPSSHRRISCFSRIVSQCRLHPSLSKIRIGRSPPPSVALFPTTKMAMATPPSLSHASVEGEYSSPAFSSLRRSTRIGNRNNGAAIQRSCVRLFQERSAEIENENEEGNNDGSLLVNSVPTEIPTDDEGAGVPTTRSKKRRVSKRKSSTVDESSEKVVKRRRPRTPARGSTAVPVTPEPSGTENDSGSARSSRKKTKVKIEVEEEKKTSKAKPKTKAKRKTTAKTKKKASRIAASWPEPDGWREVYELVRELRKDKTAPCDTMGAEALSLPDRSAVDKDMDDEEYAKMSRFHTLIALMLSSQTKDAMVGQAMENLRDTSDGSGGLTVASILDMDPKVLNSKIYSVGFRNNKTKYIKQAAQILRDDYNDDIPPTADDMIRDLPGVGPKMAYIVENICWGIQSGIGVDTHMQRLFPKLGWVSPDTKNPEQTRKQLESWLPREYWGEVNLLWVGFGQEVQQEKQKVLRKALLSDRPFEALCLLRSVDFDVYDEWNKIQSKITSGPETDRKEYSPWADENEREKINKMIEKVMLRK